MSLKKDTDTGTISEKKNCKEKHGNSSMSKGENVYGKLWQIGVFVISEYVTSQVYMYRTAFTILDSIIPEGSQNVMSTIFPIWK